MTQAPFGSVGLSRTGREPTEIAPAAAGPRPQRRSQRAPPLPPWALALRRISSRSRHTPPGAKSSGRSHLVGRIGLGELIKDNQMTVMIKERPFDPGALRLADQGSGFDHGETHRTGSGEDRVKASIGVDD